MFRTYFLSCIWSIILTCGCSVVTAQTDDRPHVHLAIEQKEVTKGDRTFPLLLKVENFRDQIFQGFIRWEADGAFRSLKGDSLFIEVEANQQRYLALRLLPTPKANAGKNEIRFSLWDNETKTSIQETKENISLEEKVQLLIRPSQEEIIVSNNLDSIDLTLLIANNGNTSQDLELVYNFPVPINGSNSFIRQVQLFPGSDSSLTFRFLMPPSLRETNEFRVQITAVGGTSKQVLGHSNIVVKNLRSSRSYSQRDNDQAFQFHHLNNGLNISRRMQGDLATYQLYGGGAINLNKGMLALNGNLSYNTATDDFYASGTSLRYGLNNLEVEMGSINTNSEANLFGRGIKVSYKDSDDQHSYSVGIMDNQFNILTSEQLFKRGYAIFGEAILGTNNLQKQWKSQFAFKQDPYEDLQSELFSIHLKRTISSSYSMEFRGHGALSQYHYLQRNRADGAFEFIQRGRLRSWNWSGNYFFSSNYFPGIRRGTWFVNHTMNKQFDNTASLWGSFNFANYTPKSYVFRYDYHNQNLRGEIGMRFPKWNQLTPGARLQFEQEKSDNYSVLFSTHNATKLQAVRLVEDLNWQSSNYQHAVYLSFDNGLARYPFSDRWKFQARGTLTYAFAGLQLMGNYQHGAYYLAEYLNSQYVNAQRLERVTLNASYFQNFFQDKLQTNVGIGYFGDFLGSQNPTSYANIRYALTDRIRVFLNGSWYQYSYTSNTKNQVTSIEGGLSLSFAKKQVSSKKKGRLEIVCFYDENSNDIWDEGEQPASAVTIAVNNEVFSSDMNGKVRYSMLPYGIYSIHGGLKDNWYFKNHEVSLSSGTTKLTIPLKQTGTLIGNIRYVFDEHLANDVEAKYAGIAVVVTRGDFSKHVVTDNDGNFTTNLPKGKYLLQLDHTTLPELVTCENPIQEVDITNNKINKIPAFILNVQNRKIRLKRFGSD